MARGRKAKSLEELTAAGTFRARKHKRLLEVEPLVADPELRSIQQRYRRASNPEVAREYSVEFEREARRQQRERETAAVDELDFVEEMAVETAAAGLFAHLEAGERVPLQRRWRRWNKVYGLRWRARFDCLSEEDLIEFAEAEEPGSTGDLSELLADCELHLREDRFERHQRREAFRAELQARKPALVASVDTSGAIPGPPGVAPELLARYEATRAAA
jgi:hypothetical protein